ncbi:HPr family phosphocarrier protein [candidate division KSB1 bacterium]|nr:HPr family phosphocarrier protein [candidate division KSB1 bacterium]
MIQKELTIPNRLGLHARPASLLVKTVARFQSDIFISRDNQIVNGKSIMGVMMLAAEYGSKVLFKISGEDEDDVLEAIIQLFERKFDED